MDGEYKRDAAKVINEYLYHFMEFIDTMDGECKRDAAKVIHEYLDGDHFMEFIDTMDGECKRHGAKVIHEYLYHFMEFIDTMDGEYKRDAAKAKQEAQPLISPDTQYLNLTLCNERTEFNTGANDDMVPLTTKDLVCYLFQMCPHLENCS